MKRLILLMSVYVLVLLGCSTTAAARYALEPGEGEYVYTYETQHDPATAVGLIDEWVQMHSKGSDHPTTPNPDLGRIVFRATMLCPVALTQLPFDYTCKVTVKDGMMNFDYQVGKMSSGMGYPPLDAMSSIKVLLASQAIDISDYVNSESP